MKRVTARQLNRCEQTTQTNHTVFGHSRYVPITVPIRIEGSYVLTHGSLLGDTFAITYHSISLEHKKINTSCSGPWGLLLSCLFLFFQKVHLEL